MINDSHNRTILTEDTEKTPLGIHLNDKYDPVHLLRLSHIATFQNYLEVKLFTPMCRCIIRREGTELSSPPVRIIGFV